MEQVNFCSTLGFELLDPDMIPVLLVRDDIVT